MKFSFSTLGCPRWTLNEILSAAKDLGYSGVELRGLGDDIFLPDAQAFKAGGLGVKNEFTSRGLEVSCISTECMLHKNAPDLEEKVMAYIRLASSLGCRGIRLLGDTDPWKGNDVDVDLVAKNLARFAPAAEEAGVDLLIETNGVFSDTRLLAQVIRSANSKNTGIVWDINHPYRYGHEYPVRTWNNIGDLVRHVQVKDSAIENGEVVYRMFGKGNLPIADAFKLLKTNGYDGHISLEWTKRWNSDLEEPGVVFSHFIYNAKKVWETCDK